MHDTERTIAGRDVVDDDAEAPDIRELLEGERFRLHLAENRIGLLLAPSDLCVRKPLGLKQFAQFLLDLLDQPLIALGELLEASGNGLVSLRVDVAEGQVLELLAHVLHAHAPCQRRIDVHRLLGDARALFGRHVVEGAHIVEAIGKFDQEHADVVRNGEQQLAKIFRLLGLFGDKVELLDLGEAFDQGADILAEEVVYLLPRRGRILDRVVQQRDGDRGFVQMHFGQDRRHFQRMGDVRIAACPLLLPVLLHGVDIGLVQQRLVDVGLVFLHALNELVLAHHPLAAP